MDGPIPVSILNIPVSIYRYIETGISKQVLFAVVYKLPHRRARAWPLGRVRRASKGQRYLAYNLCGRPQRGEGEVCKCRRPHMVVLEFKKLQCFKIYNFMSFLMFQLPSIVSFTF